MSSPLESLVGLLVASDGIPAGVNIYDGPTPQIVAPAIVPRPDNPWSEPDAYCRDLQHYVAIAVVSASSAADGVGKLYDIVRGIVAAIQSEETPWEWVSTGAPVVDESTGTAFLAAPVRLKYKNTEEEES